MRTFYLDTSAINRLFDDPDRFEVVKALSSHSKVYISVFTVAEIAATSDVERRIALVALARDISGGYHPLAMPRDLLRRALKGVQGWKKDMDASMGKEWSGLWIALCDPTEIDQQAYFEVTRWKEQQEESYQKMHKRGRPKMQGAIARLPAKERNAYGSSFPALIRAYNQRPDFINDVVYNIACGLNMIFTRERIQRVIDHSEHWRFFLASMAYGLHVRSVKPTDYGKRKTPGSIDTQQAIYLAACDIFVTADNQQHRMMRLMVPFGHTRQKKRWVWNYPQFKDWIVNIGSKGESPYELTKSRRRAFMKNLKKDLQAVTKELKALTRKTEALAKKVAKIEKGQAAVKAKPRVKAKTAKKAPAKKKAVAKKKGAALTATDRVLGIIKRSKKGVDAPTLIKKTGFEDKKIRNILFRAAKQGKIKKAGRGIYVAA